MESCMFCFNCCNKNTLISARLLSADEFKKYLNAVYPTQLTGNLLGRLSLDTCHRQERPVSRCTCEQACKPTSCCVETRQTRRHQQKQSPILGAAQTRDQKCAPDLSSVQPTSLKVENITLIEQYRRGKLESDAALRQALAVLEEAVRSDYATNSRHGGRLPEEHIDATGFKKMLPNLLELSSSDLSRLLAKICKESQQVTETNTRRESIDKESERETGEVASYNETLTDEGKINHRLILEGSAELSVELPRCKNERQRMQDKHEVFESDMSNPTNRCKDLQQKLQSSEEDSQKPISTTPDQQDTLKELVAWFEQERQFLEDIVKNLKGEFNEYKNHIAELQRIICACLTEHTSASSDNMHVTRMVHALLDCHAERIRLFIATLEAHGNNVNTEASAREVCEIESNIPAHREELHLRIAEKLEKSRQTLLVEKETNRHLHKTLIRKMESVCKFIWETVNMMMDAGGRRIIHEEMEHVLCSRTELANFRRASQAIARMSQQLSEHCAKINDDLQISRELLQNMDERNIKRQEKANTTTQTDHFVHAEISTTTANDQHENTESDYTRDENLRVHASPATNKTTSQERQGSGATSAPGFREIATRKHLSETRSYEDPLPCHDWQCAGETQTATGSRQDWSNQRKANSASEANGAEATVHQVLRRVEPAKVCDQEACRTASCKAKEGEMNSPSSITPRIILERISETSDAADADVPVACDIQGNRQESDLWDERLPTSRIDLLSEKAPEEGSFVFASEVESQVNSSDIAIHYHDKGYTRGESFEENSIATNWYHNDRGKHGQKSISKEPQAETFPLTNRTNDEPKKRSANSYATISDMAVATNKENADAHRKQDYHVERKLKTKKSASMDAIESAGTINAWVGKSPSCDSTYAPTVYSIEFLRDQTSHCRNADQQSWERDGSMFRYGGNQSKATATDRSPGTREKICKGAVGIDIYEWHDFIPKLGDRNLPIKAQSVNISKSSFAGCYPQSRKKESQLEYKSIQAIQVTNQSLTTSATFLSGASEAKLAASKVRFNSDDDEDTSDAEIERVIPKLWPKGDATDARLTRKTEEPNTHTSTRHPNTTKDAELKVPDKRPRNLHNTTGKRLSVSVGAIRRAATINAWAGKSPSYGETSISTPFSSQMTCDHEDGCRHADHGSFPYRYVLYNAHSEADSGRATTTSLSDARNDSTIELTDRVDTDRKPGQPATQLHPLTHNNVEQRAPLSRSTQPTCESSQVLFVLQQDLESSVTFLPESSDGSSFEETESFDWEYHEKVEDEGSEIAFPVQDISDDALAGPSMLQISRDVQKKRQQQRRVAYQRERSFDHSTGSTYHLSASDYDQSFLNFEFKY